MGDALHDDTPRLQEEKLYIVINNDREELFLKLRPNTNLVTQYTVIEWVLEDGSRVVRRAAGDCFYIGELQSTAQSLVAISNCDGLTGYIQTHNDSYFIEPLKIRQAQDEASRSGPQPHLIYKVQSITSRLNLSLQQDQQFRRRPPPPPPSSSPPPSQDDATVLELDDFLRRKRDAGVERSRESRTDSAKEERRRRRSPEGGGIPKFRRERVPKFARGAAGGSSSTSSGLLKTERHGRSTSHTSPKFDRARGSTRDEDLRWEGQQDVVGGAAAAERGHFHDSPATGRPHARDAPTPAPQGEAGSPDRGEEKKKKGRKKGCKQRGGGEEDGALVAGEAEDEGEDRCGGRGSSPPTDAERARRREERRSRRREERRKEKERKRQERKRRRKEERMKRREGCRKMRRIREEEEGGGGGGVDQVSSGDGADDPASDLMCQARKGRKNRKREEREQRKRDRRKKKKKKKNEKKKNPKDNDVQSEETSKYPYPDVSSRMIDPFLGEEWLGYSPDMWETQVAAGTSGLTEVSLGPSPNVTDPQKWLELVVAVDHTVITFHGEDEVEKYVFTLFNIVSAIYEDPSLEANLELVMLRIVFYKNTKQSQVRQGLAKKSLEAVNRWAERLYRVSPSYLRHDMAVWLTRSNLGGPSGYAPVAGVCEPSRSCTLNRDEGLTSAFIIAHEMAHVLGMSHDGDPLANNDCEDEGFQGSVMAPLVAATFSRFHWSKCSKFEYHRKSPNWSCLLNKPQWENATVVPSTIKYQYSLEDQCRMEFGEGYGLCSNVGLTDPCTHLWCSNSSMPHNCKTKKGPPLEGTICGKHKWCRHGLCVSVSQELDDADGESPVRHNPQDGGWGPWSHWGPCSRTCGTGVAFRTRACDHPPPAWGGRRCRGKREEWKVCGVEDCPLPHQDFRAQQCSLLTRIVNLDPRRAALSWLPYEPKRRKKKCRISCYSHTTNEVYIGREYVVDGTRCSYDQPNDICVQGKCVSMGCDKVVASRALEDECGMCGGDGATCIHHQSDYHEVPPMDYSRVAILPAGARNIMIKEETPTMNFLALSDNSSSFFLNGGKSQEPSKSFISEGAKFLYSSRGEREMLQARGPLLKPVSIMIHGSRAQESVRVTITYVTPLKQEHYQWEVGPFTACSVTCGGGQQHQTLVCRDRRTDRQVFHDRCDHLPRPSINSTTCNTFGCQAKWVTGPWEHCSTTCGPHGVQERIVSCVTLPEADTANWTTGIVDPLRCSSDPMPETERECLRDPCPANWMPIGWGECSSSCGEGVETRLWECVGVGGNEVTYDCGPHPREVRVCTKPPCPQSPCLRDASAFCQLPVLHRYCQVPKYRELCCHTCTNVVY